MNPERVSCFVMQGNVKGSGEDNNDSWGYHGSCQEAGTEASPLLVPADHASDRSSLSLDGDAFSHLQGPV